MNCPVCRGQGIEKLETGDKVHCKWCHSAGPIIDIESSAEKLLQILKERERLSKLSVEELIHEVLNTSLGDNFLVLELLNRLRPGWEDMLD